MKLTIRILPLLLAAHLLEAQTPIRIMPLGNSITQADNTHLGYRYGLWLKLQGESLDFDLVGSLNTNFNGNPVFPDNNFDRDHEGHWGWRADELLNSLPVWLASYTPDVVLMHVGTNDALQGQSVAGTIDEISDIIDALRNDNPTVTILIAKLIGTTLSQNTAIIALNNEIGALATSTNTTTSKVLVVDHYSGFNAATDTYDGIHPNEQGEEKIAQKWFDAIMGLESGDAIPPSIPTGLSASNVTSTSFTLTWNASSDNTSVTAYEVYRDGSLIGSTATTTFNINAGLTAGTTYLVTVRAGDAAGNWSAQSSGLNVTTSSLPGTGTGTGLQAQYYNTKNLSGSVVHNRVDPQVNFDWGVSAPGANVNVDNFSARWTGQVESPVSGNFIFSTLSDDGVRLWINGTQVINNWTDHGPTMNNSPALPLVAGVKYEVRLEFYENSGGPSFVCCGRIPDSHNKPFHKSASTLPRPTEASIRKHRRYRPDLSLQISPKRPSHLHGTRPRTQ